MEFDHLGIPFTRQEEFPVYYRYKKIGSYYSGMVVDGKIILELKSVVRLNVNLEAQLLNYLGISGLSVGYLVNFRNSVLDKKKKEIKMNTVGYLIIIGFFLIGLFTLVGALRGWNLEQILKRNPQ